MGYQPKKCKVCKSKFTPTSGKQWRCSDCAEKKARPDKPPKCACGCRESVTWQNGKGWNKFLLGHATRTFKTPPATGHTPWNKGNRTVYEHECANCEEGFESRLADAKYCSRECFHTDNKGENHPLWKGGKKTKYSFTVRNKRLHRAVMVELLDRKLKKTEVVHHIDGKGTNNHVSNLHLFHCQGCHARHHNLGLPLKYIYPEFHTTKKA